MFVSKTGLTGDNIDVVPLGFDPEEIANGKTFSTSSGYWVFLPDELS